MACEFCGEDHESDHCPKIAAIEYYPSGRRKRVELRGDGESLPADDRPRIVLTGGLGHTENRRLRAAMSKEFRERRAAERTETEQPQPETRRRR